MKKLLFFVILFTLIIGVAGFWYWQKNPYSRDILKLEILGPQTSGIGEEMVYTVKYKNNGNIRLEEPRLVFEFPEHSFIEQNNGKRKEMGPGELGDIYPGEEKTIEFKARLFGKEGELKTAKAWLSYRPKNLNARYESGTTFTTAIESFPLTFDFDLPSKAESGREFDFSLNYFSSLDYPLYGLGVRIEYPSGFEFIKSSPGSLGVTDWEIPLLNKAEGGRIQVSGRLLGQEKERKIFKSSLGIWLEDEFIPLKEAARGVEIVKPNIFITQQINGSRGYTANPGDELHYEIFFKNISEEPFQELFLAVTLEGRAFDLDTMTAQSGQVRHQEGAGQAVWEWRDVPRLKFLDKGEEGKVDLFVRIRDNWEVKSIDEKNFSLKSKVLISQAQEEFETKINSKLEVEQKGYFGSGPFENSGPLPPKSGEKTTYTIMWQVKNYYNDVKNAKVKARLPGNVRLTGKISPSEESPNFTFDNMSREIVWSVQDDQLLKAGTGIFTAPPAIAFQVELSPGSGDSGRAMALISEARIQGEDQWTDTIIAGTSSGIDTNLPDDQTAASERGIVVQ